MSELIGADIESVKKSAKRRMEEAMAESCCPHCRPRRCPCCGRILDYDYPYRDYRIWEVDRTAPVWVGGPGVNRVTCHA